MILGKSSGATSWVAASTSPSPSTTRLLSRRSSGWGCFFRWFAFPTAARQDHKGNAADGSAEPRQRFCSSRTIRGSPGSSSFGSSARATPCVDGHDRPKGSSGLPPERIELIVLDQQLTSGTKRPGPLPADQGSGPRRAGHPGDRPSGRDSCWSRRCGPGCATSFPRPPIFSITWSRSSAG